MFQISCDEILNEFEAQEFIEFVSSVYIFTGDAMKKQLFTLLFSLVRFNRYFQTIFL